ncbi:hypothetical protein HK101_002133 [Irineochytrium annulatum]|nr:hypothetical protein HK101_002133 [Irineochytrium annulatum]
MYHLPQVLSATTATSTHDPPALGGAPSLSLSNPLYAGLLAAFVIALCAALIAFLLRRRRRLQRSKRDLREARRRSRGLSATRGNTPRGSLHHDPPPFGGFGAARDKGARDSELAERLREADVTGGMIIASTNEDTPRSSPLMSPGRKSFASGGGGSRPTSVRSLHVDTSMARTASGRPSSGRPSAGLSDAFVVDVNAPDDEEAAMEPTDIETLQRISMILPPVGAPRSSRVAARHSASTVTLVSLMNGAAPPSPTAFAGHPDNPSSRAGSPALSFEHENQHGRHSPLPSRPSNSSLDHHYHAHSNQSLDHFFFDASHAHTTHLSHQQGRHSPLPSQRPSRDVTTTSSSSTTLRNSSTASLSVVHSWASSLDHAELATGTHQGRTSRDHMVVLSSEGAPIAVDRQRPCEVDVELGQPFASSLVTPGGWAQVLDNERARGGKAGTKGRVGDWRREKDGRGRSPPRSRQQQDVGRRDSKRVRKEPAVAREPSPLRSATSKSIHRSSAKSEKASPSSPPNDGRVRTKTISRAPTVRTPTTKGPTKPKLDVPAARRQRITSDGRPARAPGDRDRKGKSVGRPRTAGSRERERSKKYASVDYDAGVTSWVMAQNGYADDGMVHEDWEEEGRGKGRSGDDWEAYVSKVLRV